MKNTERKIFGFFLGASLFTLFGASSAQANVSTISEETPTYKIADTRKYYRSTSAEETGTSSLTDSETKPYIPWTFPGIVVNSQTGYGAQWGNVFVGVGVQNRTRGTTTADGALGAGFGIGNARKIVAIEASVSVLSMTGADAFKRGALNLKASRALPAGFGLAFGSEYLATWGGNLDGTRNWYGAVSKVFFMKDDPTKWFSALTLNAGVGSGRFNKAGDVNQVGVFGSAAIRVKEPLSFIADWSGQDLNLGLSITPFRKVGFYINPAVVDITQNVGDGARFILGLGYGYTFG